MKINKNIFCVFLIALMTINLFAYELTVEDFEKVTNKNFKVFEKTLKRSKIIDKICEIVLEEAYEQAKISYLNYANIEISRRTQKELMEEIDYEILEDEVNKNYALRIIWNKVISKLENKSFKFKIIEDDYRKLDKRLKGKLYW